MKLINISVEKIVNWCNIKLPIDKTERVVILYGFELLIETIIKTFIFFILAFIFNQGMEVFIILLTFCSLRVHAGGFHFKSNLGCSSAMIFICLGAISLSKIILLSNYTIICIFIILLMLVCRFAPADFNNNNNITKQNRQRMKFNSLIVLCIVFLMALLIDLNNIRVLITVSSSIEVISIIPFFKGEIKNEHKRQII